MHNLKALLLTACVIPNLAFGQSPEEGEFMGVFSTDNIYIKGCEIVNIGSIVSATYYGYGRFGLDFEFGIIDSASNTLFKIDDDLKEMAIDKGYNAVIASHIQLSHTGDAVYESGTHWKADGKSYDFAGSYVTIAYGTPALVECGTPKKRK